jgi:hypothetical protein
MLLVLASVVFLGSESLGTRDHILLSQIWDFPFRRLLRLEGSRWRYSTPPPHGCYRCNFFRLIYINPVRTSQETHYVSATKPNRLMLFICENHTEHINTLWGHNIEFYLMTLLVSQNTSTWRRIMEWALHDEFEILQKESIVLNLMQHPGIFLEALCNTTKWLPGQSVSRPIFEPEISQLQAKSFRDWIKLLRRWCLLNIYNRIHYSISSLLHLFFQSTTVPTSFASSK